MKKTFTRLLAAATALLPLLGLWSTANGQILFDNGPIVNSVGTGAGGADESMLYTTTFGMSTIGFGHQSALFNRVADDFVIPDCHWRIDSIVFFGYQTGSTTTSTFTGVNFRIWDSIPDAVGSNVVFGDTTTNRLTSTRWSGVYRITETTHLATNRPIMRNVCALNNVVLTTGTYWIDWASLGSLASGPWAQARTPMNLAITGNGKQRIGTVWNNLVDGGTGTPAQGLPFIIYGTVLDPVVDAGADQSICPGNTAMIGGSPAGSGGTAPLTYSWSPGTGLSSTTIGNPLAAPSGSMMYVLSVTDATGCTVMDTMNLNVGAVASNFLPADTTICFGTTITLDAGSANSYTWSNGDTTQTTNVGPGTYSVDVDNGSGCNATDTVTISATTPVEIVGNGTVCAALGDTLCTQMPYVTYAWSIGATTPCIIVNVDGVYTVMTTDSLGCTTMDTFSVTTIPSPTANFNFNVGAAGLTYTFTDGSSNATSWSWNFGDNGTSTQQNPSHTYTASGNYTVTLIATNACGSDTFTQSLTVVNIDGVLAGEIEISPIPAKDKVRVNISGMESSELAIELIDLQGRKIAAWSHETASGALSTQVDVSSFARGVYYLRFTSDSGSSTRKLILE